MILYAWYSQGLFDLKIHLNSFIYPLVDPFIHSTTFTDAALLTSRIQKELIESLTSKVHSPWCLAE
jgi:hypothetical protein